jgi:hypothetical protein
MTPSDQDAATDIEMMLPWHAAGTLSRRDAQRVDEALKRDPELARRYALVREELGETIGLNESLGAPSGRIMTDLFARIDAEPQRRTAAAPGLGARIAEFIAALTPRTLAYAGGAAAIAILLQAGIIGSIMLKQSAGTYETASAPGAQSSAGAFALIRFAPQASQDDVTKFLAANKLSVVAGPMNGGLYRVRIAAEKLPQADLAARIQQLQDGRVIAFIAASP